MIRQCYETEFHLKGIDIRRVDFLEHILSSESREYWTPQVQALYSICSGV